MRLLDVVAHSGAWEKYGLNVEYDRFINAEAVHEAVLKGDVEFIGGNHVSPYGHRARSDKWIYTGQTVNVVPGRKLVVRADSPINGSVALRYQGEEIGRVALKRKPFSRSYSANE